MYDSMLSSSSSFEENIGTYRIERNPRICMIFAFDCSPFCERSQFIQPFCSFVGMANVLCRSMHRFDRHDNPILDLLYSLFKQYRKLTMVLLSILP